MNNNTNLVELNSLDSFKRWQRQVECVNFFNKYVPEYIFNENTVWGKDSYKDCIDLLYAYIDFMNITADNSSFQYVFEGVVKEDRSNVDIVPILTWDKGAVFQIFEKDGQKLISELGLRDSFDFMNIGQPITKRFVRKLAQRLEGKKVLDIGWHNTGWLSTGLSAYGIDSRPVSLIELQLSTVKSYDTVEDGAYAKCYEMIRKPSACNCCKNMHQYIKYYNDVSEAMEDNLDTDVVIFCPKNDYNKNLLKVEKYYSNKNIVTEINSFIANKKDTSTCPTSYIYTNQEPNLVQSGYNNNIGICINDDVDMFYGL